MKFLIAFSCLLAVASAGYINAPLAYAASDDGAYRGEGLYESAYKGEGILEANNLGYAYNTPYAYGAHVAGPIAHAVSPYAHAYGAHVARAYAAPAVGLASEARLVDPVAIAAGAPLPTGDTVEVAAAKAAHFEAHAAAKGVSHAVPVSAYGVHAYGAHAYGAHAYAAPIAHGYTHGYAGHFASEARLVDPVAIAAGAPLPTGDTVEVAAAKAFHHQAHVAAKHGHFIAKRSPGYLGASAYAAPLAYSSPAHSYGYSAYASPLAYSAPAHSYGYSTYASPIAHTYAAPLGHAYAKTHLIGKRSPGFVGASTYAAPLAYSTPLAYSAPVHSYGYSAYAGPYAHNAGYGYGYGRLGAFYG